MPIVVIPDLSNTHSNFLSRISRSEMLNRSSYFVILFKITISIQSLDQTSKTVLFHQISLQDLFQTLRSYLIQEDLDFFFRKYTTLNLEYISDNFAI